MGNGKVNMVRIEVPSLLIGHTVNEISIIGEINVVAISRSNKTFIPSLGTILEAEDTLYLAVNYTATNKLKSMLGLV
jgi:trk system potassium uptake protein TrkA